MADQVSYSEVSFVRRISWGAIIAGTLIALVTWLTLSLLGLAVGFSTINPTSETNPFGGLGIGAAIWWIIVGIASLFVGGMVAGRLAGSPRRADGAMNGIISWAVTSLVMVYFLTSSVGTIIGGAFGIIRTGVSATGQAAVALAPQIAESMGNGGKAQDQAKQIAKDPKAQQQISSLLDRISKSDTVSRADRDSLVNLLVAQANMSRPDAEQAADRMISTYETVRKEGPEKAQQAQAQARQMGEQAASAAARASLAAFFLMILGAAAAAWGGAVGAPMEFRRSTTTSEIRKAA